jgi:hypothetical protein
MLLPESERYESSLRILKLITQREREMTTLKAWLGDRLETPEKARTTLSNIAVLGGVVGVVLTLIAVIIAQV